MKSPALKYAALFFSLTAAGLFYCYQRAYFPFEETVQQSVPSPQEQSTESTEKVETDSAPTFTEKPIVRKKFNKEGKLPSNFSMDPETTEREAAQMDHIRMMSSKSMIFRPAPDVPFEAAVTVDEKLGALLKPTDSIPKDTSEGFNFIYPPVEQRGAVRMSGTKVMIMPSQRPLLEPKTANPYVKPSKKKATGQVQSPFNKSHE